jgi:hypothetical protein
MRYEVCVPAVSECLIGDLVHDSFQKNMSFLDLCISNSLSFQEGMQACSAAYGLLNSIGLDQSNMYRSAFHSFWMLSATLRRCFEKPAGYAGDWKTILMLYENQPVGSDTLSKAIDTWALNTASARAVRYRRKMLTERLREVGKGRVLSLGSGPAVEVLDCLRDGCEFLIDLVDIDESALLRVYGEASQMGRGAQVNTHRININKLASCNLPDNYDLIYSAGLIDYFDDSQCLNLLNWCSYHVLNEGEIILGNFKTDHTDRQLLDTVLNWPLILRSEEHLASLHSRSKLADREFDIISGDGDAQLFMRSRARAQNSNTIA